MNITINNNSNKTSTTQLTYTITKSPLPSPTNTTHQHHHYHQQHHQYYENQGCTTKTTANKNIPSHKVLISLRAIPRSLKDGRCRTSEFEEANAARSFLATLDPTPTT